MGQGALAVRGGGASGSEARDSQTSQCITGSWNYPCQIAEGLPRETEAGDQSIVLGWEGVARGRRVVTEGHSSPQT